MPEAITAFLEGESFEDVIRTAVSLGGDCDTLTCIAASIAEAYYGIDDSFMQEVFGYVSADMKEVLEHFLSARYKTNFKSHDTWGNQQIVRAIQRHERSRTERTAIHFIRTMKNRINQNASIYIPVEMNRNPLTCVDSINVGDEICLDDDLLIKFRTINQKFIRDEDEILYVMFTDEDEMHKGSPTDSLEMDLRQFLECALANEEVFGVSINPFGSNNIILSKETIHIILSEEV